MAGIFDNWRETIYENPILRGFLVSPESGRAYEAQRAQEQYANDARGLLDAAYSPNLSPTGRGLDGLPPQSSGLLGLSPEQLRQPSQYPQSFPDQRQPGMGMQDYLKLGTIPGYAGLGGHMAANAASNQAAMDRQVQEQGWSVNPASNQSQKLALDRQQQEAYISHLREQEKISRGNLGINQEQLGLQQAEFLAKYVTDGKGGFMPRQDQMKLEPNHIWSKDPVSGQPLQSPAPGTTKWREGRDQVDTLESGIKGLDNLEKHYQDYGTFEIGNRAAAKTAEVNRQQAITAMGVLSNMGVLQPGDLDRLTKQLADPTDFTGGFTNTGGAIAAVQEVKQRLNQARIQRLRAMPTLIRTPEPPK